ncbi:hypothetical protein LCGC14_0538840 [marine sediment metagenome]|uniref:Uncharacterized protein n=1 Tax=marine sediment metagenome TaxID=412755 RepID=A0A0F9V1S0_9ZZZZ
MLHARDDYNKRIQDNANRIPDDEPVFLLRGQDAIAPILLDMYVAISEIHPACDPVVIKAVKNHANAMRDWQEKVRSKFADMDIRDEVY